MLKSRGAVVKSIYMKHQSSKGLMHQVPTNCEHEGQDICFHRAYTIVEEMDKYQHQKPKIVINAGGYKGIKEGTTRMTSGQGGLGKTQLILDGEGRAL